MRSPLEQFTHSEAPRGKSGRRGRLPSRRTSLLLAAIFGALLVSVIAFKQHPRADLSDPSGFWDWFLHPLEWNAHASVHVLKPELRDLCAVPGTTELWICGTGGFIAHSPDDGRTWETFDVPPVAPNAESSPASTPFPSTPKLVPTPSSTPPSGAKAASAANAGRNWGADERDEFIQVADERRVTPAPAETPAPTVTGAPGNLKMLKGEEPKVTPNKAANVATPRATPANDAKAGTNEQTNLPANQDSSKAAATPTMVTTPGTPNPSPSSPAPTATPQPKRANLNAIHFFDSKHGWAVGQGGAAYSFDARSRKWVVMPAPMGNDSIESVRVEAQGVVHVLTRSAASHVGNFYRYLGARWSMVSETSADSVMLLPRVGLPPANPPNFSHRADRNSPRGGSNQGSLTYVGKEELKTVPANPSSAAEAQLSGVRPYTDWHALSVVGPDLGWGLATETLYSSEDGLKTWKAICAVGTGWSKVIFRDASDGWLISKKGAIAATRDGGKTWLPVAFHSRLPEWVPAKEGLPTMGNTSGLVNTYSYTITATSATDTGLKGQDISVSSAGRLKYETLHPGIDPTFLLPPFARQWHIFPAPWYFLSLILLGLVCKPALTPPPEEKDKDQRIEAIFQSDAPLTPGQPDAMQFGSLATGISHFLRNENTAPPLTLAITGEWGSGKSSLMNLLRDDLERRGFRPVWFNPWHHQKEEHLLAALLENVIEQALPPVWSLAGAGYRTRLVWTRVRKKWVLWALMAIVLAGGGSYVAHLDTNERRREIGLVKWTGQAVVTQVRDILGGGKDEPKDQAAEAKDADATAKKAVPSKPGEPAAPAKLGEPPEPEGSLPATLLVLISAIGTVVSIFKVLSSFGVNPASLLARESHRAKLADLRAQTGFRYKFMREFEEVSEALNPRTMLILIDDLDRCQPKAVVETLEAVNFLVSSGDCFVVIGMAKERVEGCIRAAFKKDSDVLFKEGETLGAFAQNYIEKLINIIVPVPQVNAAQACEILAAEPEAETDRRKQARMLWRDVFGIAASVGVMALVGGIAWWAFGFGKNEAAIVNQRVTAKAVAQLIPTVSSEPFALTAEPTPKPVAPEKTAEVPRAELIAAVPANWTHWMSWLAPAVVLAFGIWRLFSRPAVVTHDSPAYLDALRTWQPLIGTRSGTPRALKRFLNHLRFLDSRQRGLSESETSIIGAQLEIARTWLLARKWLPQFVRDVLTVEPTPAQASAEIDASILVGMAAAKYAIKDWKTGDALPTDLPTELKLEVAVWARLQTLSTVWPPHAEAFERLSRVVQFS